MLIYFKYLSWAIATLTPFIGTYFFNFSESIPGTSRKRLTRSGRVAFSISALGIAVGLMLSIATDRQGARDAEAKAVAEANEQIWKNDLKESQLDVVTAQEQLRHKQEDTISLLKILGADTDVLSPEEQQVVIQVASDLPIERLNEIYPDLAERLARATTFDDTQDILQEKIYRDTNAFFVHSKTCDEIFPPGDYADRFSKFASVKDFKGYDTLRLLFWVRGTGPTLSIDDNWVVVHGFNDDNPMSNSRAIELTFEGSRLRAQCEPIADECEIRLRDESGRQLLRTLSTQSLQSIVVQREDGPWQYTIPSDTAVGIRNASNCLKS